MAKVPYDALRGRIDLPGVEGGTLAWNPSRAEPTAEDLLVRAAFEFLTKNGALSRVDARALGRHLGREAPPEDRVAFLDAFSHLGIGRLLLAREESARYTFHGEGLVGADKPDSTTCAIALGFAEGLVQAATGGDALGTELSCRSRGGSQCTFVVVARRAQ